MKEPKTYYEVKHLIKLAEEDVYQEGCIPNSAIGVDVEVSFQNESLDGLINEIKEFVGSVQEGVRIDTIEEGRIDFQVNEREDGLPADENDIQAWKEGRRRIWDVDYIAHVDYVVRFENVNLEFEHINQDIEVV